jgi:urease accessory protein
MKSNLLFHFHSHGGNGREHADTPGHFHDRDLPVDRDFKQRAFTVGVGGPVGSG